MKLTTTSDALSLLTWQEARTAIQKSDSVLAEIIDDIDPDSEYTLLKANYPFGTTILRNGLIYLPDKNNQTAPITNCGLTPSLSNAINYSHVPLGVIVKNAIEIFYDIQNNIQSKIFSIASFDSGFHMGIWEHLGCGTPYTITSGARSLYMIPKISISTSHKKLKMHYGIKQPPPKNLYSQWKIFNEIYKSLEFAQPWTSELIFFTKKWADKLASNNPKWSNLKNFILRQGWNHSGYGRKKVGFAFMLQALSHTFENQGIKPDPYLTDTLQHLMLIASGELPGSTPYKGDNRAGPLDEIQKVYVDTYGLKTYVPTIMQPQHLKADLSSPVYYSLQTPTLLNSSRKMKTKNSNVDDIRDLKEMITLLQSISFENNLEIDGINIKQLINSTHFEFFHCPTCAYGSEIRPATEMPVSDADLLYSSTSDNKRFADNGSFVRGCVRISKR